MKIIFKKSTMICSMLLFLLASVDVILSDHVMQLAHSQQQLQLKDDEHAAAARQPRDRGGIAPREIDEAIRSELKIFPIPLSTIHPEYRYAFEDSWMSPRSFGGDRGHEGTDIMLTPNTRGVFPVLSMTDGIVEKMGWLPQGGYRIGIRSGQGIYYYYAHLYDYVQNLQAGDSVRAGQLLGFAGDSGYSNIEGTVGNFDVHLHVGIYYDNEQGKETSINPYEYLIQLKDKTQNIEF